ncbi:hypothetical protein [Haladaptatus caseinilyticus]|uniref:hypothetical protein n=1 Tax=Haladaptatus caseinilyticus TaxID=2993314 RepID=UPI00224B1C4F|nr:hypothetical protein [Haladaptatus caseinilyticus]
MHVPTGQFRWRSVGLLVLLIVGIRRLRQSVAHTREVPLSPLVARGRVGANYLEQHDVTTGANPSGEMDDMAAYARDDFYPESVHRAVRRFYERTGEYDLSYHVRWHRGFRLGATLALRLMRHIEQFNLPSPSEPSTGTLSSRIVSVSVDDDPRDETRAWIRTDESDTAVFVATYASHVRNETRYVNIAAPLPWSNLSTVLHVRQYDFGGESDGIELTTKTKTGDEGLYFVTPIGSVTLPMQQTFRVVPDGDGIRACHEMWLFGRQFLTIEYRSHD